MTTVVEATVDDVSPCDDDDSIVEYEVGVTDDVK